MHLFEIFIVTQYIHCTLKQILIQVRCHTLCDAFIINCLPGHARFVQSLVSVVFPAQVFPPFCGGGLEHVRTCVLVPCPQDVLHGVHDDQSAHIPSTVKKIKNK